MTSIAGSHPMTTYVETPQGHVAYQSFGQTSDEADGDIVFITNALLNIDAVWDEPSAARFLDRLGTMGRVVMFNMLGSGVSDPIADRSTWPPIETTVETIHTVLDAAGMDRVRVYGDTEGGFFAMMLAATRPERVTSLALVNCMASVVRSKGYPMGIPSEAAASLSDMYVAQHGTTGAVLELTAPSVAGDPRFRQWWTRYQRLCVPPGLVRSTFDWFTETDVRAALPAIQAPTLVVGRREARYHRIAFSEYIARNIADAELAILDGTDTLPFHAGEFGPVLDAVEEFFTGRTQAIETHRFLSTVLISDIVDSTGTASQLGDERWIDLLTDHDRIVRGLLNRFGGHEVKMTGDGCLSTFDGPARAIECATAMVARLAEIGLSIRVGIHTGEIELRDGDIGGVGVHIAARVMDVARSGGIVVSGTVKDLVVGSQTEFTACGVTELAGIPGEWALFEVEV
jgi:class 3 adenylate cyclase